MQPVGETPGRSLCVQGASRMAVAAIVEPLTAVIMLLLLWGMIGRVSLALLVAVGLALAVVLLVVATLLGSACAVSMGRWQRGDSR